MHAKLNEFQSGRTSTSVNLCCSAAAFVGGLERASPKLMVEYWSQREGLRASSGLWSRRHHQHQKIFTITFRNE